jgi:hypothetical protein
MERLNMRPSDITYCPNLSLRVNKNYRREFLCILRAGIERV